MILVRTGKCAQFDRAKVLSVCLHEVGHALGLHGHSSNSKDVMFLAANIFDPDEAES